MNVKNINAPESETMECLDLIQTVIRPTGQPAHSPLDASYILIEAILQLSIWVHLDWGLSTNGEVKLEITQEEALRLAPMLMPTIQELVREELPEELQDRLLDEMNRRAVRALDEIPQGEYTALAEATLKLIHQEDSTNREPLVENLGEDRTEDLEP